MIYARLPFPSLSCDCSLSSGGAGNVFAISKTIAFKCPLLYDNGGPQEEERMEASIESLENEKQVYTVLASNPHPNILHGILCVSEGIFMERMETTLGNCFRDPSFRTSADTQEKWIKQLVSAAAWLEDWD